MTEYTNPAEVEKVAEAAQQEMAFNPDAGLAAAVAAESAEILNLLNGEVVDLDGNGAAGGCCGGACCGGN